MHNFYFENNGPIEKFLEISKDFPIIVVLKNPANGFPSYFVYLDLSPPLCQKRCQILILKYLILPVHFGTAPPVFQFGAFLHGEVGKLYH